MVVVLLSDAVCLSCQPVRPQTTLLTRMSACYINCAKVLVQLFSLKHFPDFRSLYMKSIIMPCFSLSRSLSECVCVFAHSIILLS